MHLATWAEKGEGPGNALTSHPSQQVQRTLQHLPVLDRIWLQAHPPVAVLVPSPSVGPPGSLVFGAERLASLLPQLTPSFPNKCVLETHSGGSIFMGKHDFKRLNLQVWGKWGAWGILSDWDPNWSL